MRQGSTDTRVVKSVAIKHGWAGGGFRLTLEHSLESIGVPGRYEGREAIEGFFRFVREVYPDMDLENNS